MAMASSKHLHLTIGKMRNQKALFSLDRAKIIISLSQPLQTKLNLDINN
jgi:hypothetical protein